MHEHDPSLPLAILNSLHEQIAFVNKEGVIEWVNHAWVRFGEENSPTGRAPSAIGVNYFDVCASAKNPTCEREYERFVEGSKGYSMGMQKSSTWNTRAMRLLPIDGFGLASIGLPHPFKDW